jgi:hypothetical protein
MKIKLVLTALLSLTISLAVYSQDDDGWESQTFNVGDFSKIRIEGAFRVHLVQGDEFSVMVKSPNPEVFEDIKIKNYGNRVEIKTDRSIFDFSRISLYINFRTIEELQIEGGVNLKTNGYLDLGNFYVFISGGANVDLFMKADKVQIDGEGGFLFELKGVSNTLDISINGAGHVDAAELKTKHASFTTVGFGTGTVYPTESLDVKIEGVGKLRYKGDPKVTQYIDGLGSVKRY